MFICKIAYVNLHSPASGFSDPSNFDVDFPLDGIFVECKHQFQQLSIGIFEIKFKKQHNRYYKIRFHQ